jgi:hypothetical protein
MITNADLKTLSTSQKCEVGQYYAKAEFVVHGFEILQPNADTGVDFCVRRGPACQVYDVQVKYTCPSVEPYVYAKKWRSESTFLFCAVRFDETASVYVARATDWGEFSCLNYQSDGGKAGPYYSMLFSQKHAESRQQLLIANYAARLIVSIAANDYRYQGSGR